MIMMGTGGQKYEARNKRGGEKQKSLRSHHLLATGSENVAFSVDDVFGIKRRVLNVLFFEARGWMWNGGPEMRSIGVVLWRNSEATVGCGGRWKYGVATEEDYLGRE